MTRRCSKCGEEKSIGDFSRDRSKRSGLRSACKVCCGVQQEQWRALNPDYRTLHTYNLTPAQFAAMSQVCEICGTADDLVVDHDHDTNGVRGRLCRQHNSAIGLLGDDPALVRAALVYLMRERAALRAA